MIVVGGTYIEICDIPQVRFLAGSGLRGAGAIATVGDVTLCTAIDEGIQEEAGVIAAGLGVGLQPSTRDQLVGFRYFTPMSPPTIDGPHSRFETPLQADDQTVVSFGMIESGPRQIRAKSCVVDPQQPRDLTGIAFDHVVADRMALVCNRSEIRAIGSTDGLIPAATAARDRLGVDVVVVKRGAIGCTVFEGIHATDVGPNPTRTVWPIGSGDVFAAAFAHGWGSGMDAVDAATMASHAAAWWCGTRNPTVPRTVLEGGRADSTEIRDPLGLVESPRVYLAGPFFSLGQRWLVESAKEGLVGLGAQVFSPFHDVGPGGDEVASADLGGLQDADAVLALIDGWDAGTVYECGWAQHHGVPVVAFGHDSASEGAKMLVGAGAELHEDFSSALYRSVWAAMGQSLEPGRVGPIFR